MFVSNETHVLQLLISFGRWCGRPFTGVGGKQVLPEGEPGGGAASTVTAIHTKVTSVGI